MTSIVKPGWLSRGGVVAVAASLTLVGCTLDNAKLETDIKTELKGKKLEVDSISCPAGRKMAADDKFECTGKTKSGDAFTIKVAQTDTKGSVKWDLVGRIVDPKEVEERLKKTGGDTFSCGTDTTIAVKNTKMKCKSGEKVVTVNFTDDEGSVELKED